MLYKPINEEGFVSPQFVQSWENLSIEQSLWLSGELTNKRRYQYDYLEIDRAKLFSFFLLPFPILPGDFDGQ